MTEINIRDFTFSYLQAEYKRYAGFMNNYVTHIERLYNENFIQNTERNQYLKQINELIRDLSNVYNDKLKSMNNSTLIENEKDDKSEKTEIKEKSKAPIKKNNNVNSNLLKDLVKNIKPSGIDDLLENNLIECMDLMKTLKVQTYNSLYINDFNEIKNKLLKMSTEIGFYNIADAMNLAIGSSYKKVLFLNNNDFEEYFNIINEIFIPVNFTKKNRANNKDSFKPTINSYLSSTDNENAIDNWYEISIVTDRLNINLEGFYKYEPINILVRTSQICRHFIFSKKKELEEHANSVKYINDKFKTVYIKNLTIGEILSLDKSSFMKKIDNDYDKYAKYSKMTFKNLMSEFNKEGATQLKNMFSIIKLLLLGDDDCINIAGLLFGLTKDKKFGTGVVSDLIYKNLSYTSQIRLRKSSISLKAELEKLKAMTPDDVDLKKQIATCKNMPASVKKVAMEKVDEMKSGSSEYYKQLTYVNLLISYPWIGQDDQDVFNRLGGDINRSKEFLEGAKSKLDKLVFGHDACKGVIQELIGKWLTNPNSIGKAIGLVGPPGVGKTLIAKGLGEALDIPFAQINLGGLEDGCVISGHSYTYSAAQPGLLVRKMVEAGKPRCVIFFDELDKACAKHGVNEIFNVLIHATDPNTNTAFNDKFFQEVTFPLNKALFVFSYNDASKVDRILLDRMEKIDVAPYSVADKVKIVNDFMLKEISDGIGLDYGCVKIEDSLIEHIIESYTFEAGVRELKRKLETLFLKLNLDRIYKKGVFEKVDNFSKDNPINLTSELIAEYLSKPNLNLKTIHKTPDIGIINGLYATTGGSGGIIPILIYSNFIGTKNKFSLKLTGSQGKVMKESVSFAFTTAMNLVKDSFKNKFIKNFPYGLHIHTPDGATPKDGPSAGSAFTTAFISRILGKKIRNDIAMTGEIEMNGRITEIGGLAYKLMGAKKAGIKLVFVPKENEKDYNKILDSNPKLMGDDFKVKIVEHISDILEGALLEDDGTDLNPNDYLA